MTPEPQPDAPPRAGLLLVGHGTREPAGVAQFLELGRLFAEHTPEAIVEPCFLELAEPSIAVGLDRLLARGIDELIVAPLLLFSAGHAKEDIPAAVRTALVAAGSDLVPRQSQPLACHRELLALSRERFQAVAGKAIRDSLTLVMIGRGSRDAAAIEEMQRYAALHAAQLGLAPPVVGFLAVARPTLNEALELAASALPRRIVVQPHLLFEGLLSAEVREAVVGARRRRPHIEWRCADPVGPQLGLVRALRSVCWLSEVACAARFASPSAAASPDNALLVTSLQANVAFVGRVEEPEADCGLGQDG